MEQYIKISVIYIDDDESLQFQIEVCSASCKSILEFYDYADCFQEFAKGLTNFPKTIKDNVVFQVGEDGEESNWAYFLKLKVYCYEANGHSAINVIMDNRGDEQTRHRSEYSLTTLPANLNTFGQRLLKWNPKTDKIFEWNA